MSAVCLFVLILNNAPALRAGKNDNHRFVKFRRTLIESVRRTTGGRGSRAGREGAAGGDPLLSTGAPARFVPRCSCSRTCAGVTIRNKMLGPFFRTKLRNCSHVSQITFFITNFHETILKFPKPHKLVIIQFILSFSSLLRTILPSGRSGARRVPPALFRLPPTSRAGYALFRASWLRSELKK